MNVILYFGVFFISGIIGLFAISNIILPLFYTIPRLNREKRIGNLKKKVPFIMIIWSPIIWLIILIIGIYILWMNFPEIMIYVYIGLGFAFIMILKRLLSNHKDLNEDFINTYKEHLIKF